MQHLAEDHEKGSRKRIGNIKKRLSGMGLVCSGTLSKRTKTCGKPNCKCATDPDARHGPYHEWTRSEEGRLVHKTISSTQAKELKKAIANYRELKELLFQWKKESAKIVLASQKRKG